MSADVTERIPEGWLYTREDESVRVEVHEDGGVWAASILGPGTENRLRVFRTQEAFETFRAEHDRELVSKGFRLRAISERRVPEAGPDSPQPAPVIPHNRRRRR